MYTTYMQKVQWRAKNYLVQERQFGIGVMIWYLLFCQIMCGDIDYDDDDMTILLWYDQGDYNSYFYLLLSPDTGNRITRPEAGRDTDGAPPHIRDYDGDDEDYLGDLIEDYDDDEF